MKTAILVLATPCGAASWWNSDHVIWLRQNELLAFSLAVCITHYWHTVKEVGLFSQAEPLSKWPGGQHYSRTYHFSSWFLDYKHWNLISTEAPAKLALWKAAKGVVDCHQALSIACLVMSIIHIQFPLHTKNPVHVLSSELHETHTLEMDTAIRCWAPKK